MTEPQLLFLVCFVVQPSVCESCRFLNSRFSLSSHRLSFITHIFNSIHNKHNKNFLESISYQILAAHTLEACAIVMAECRSMLETLATACTLSVECVDTNYTEPTDWNTMLKAPDVEKWIAAVK
jgi:hypothetical protein